MRKPFEFADVATIDDGRVATAMDELIEAAIADCMNRPGVKGARKVALELLFVPRIEDREITDVEVEFAMTARVPKRASRVLTMAVEGGRPVWNALSPDDPRQLTLDEPHLRDEGGPDGR